MTSHLQVETLNGKTRIKIVELPDKPVLEAYPGEYATMFKRREEDALDLYNAEKDIALSKGIEVHPDSVELATRLIAKEHNITTCGKFTRIPDGLYPVSVRVKERRLDCARLGDFKPCGCQGSKCYDHKEYAIL